MGKIKLDIEPFEGWIIKSEIGSGSFGVVYLAEKADERAAIKHIVVPDDATAEKANKSTITSFYKPQADRMIDEINVMKKVKGNPNVVYCLDYKKREIPNRGWEILIMMEYLTPFEQYVQQKGITFEGVLKLGIDLCNALHECKEEGIIHRDVKEANILVDTKRGIFKLSDFGVSKNLESMTHGNTRTGTRGYMAPEVERGTKHDYRADIYSLGIVLYKLLNENCIPFMTKDGDVDDRDKSYLFLSEGRPIPKLNKWGDAVDRLIEKACAYNVENRFDSFEKLGEELRAIKEKTDFSLLKKYAIEPEPDYEPKIRPIDEKDFNPDSKKPPLTPPAGESGVTEKADDRFIEGEFSTKVSKMSTGKIKNIAIAAVAVIVIAIALNLWSGGKGKVSADNSSDTKAIAAEKQQDAKASALPIGVKAEAQNQQQQAVQAKDSIARKTGVLYFEDKKTVRYEGEVVFSKEKNEEIEDGHGKSYSFTGGLVEYEGEWKNGAIYIKEFQSGKHDLVYENRVLYSGEWNNGVFNGQGKRIYVDGTTYEGEYRVGEKSGQGTMIRSNGDKYTGEWKKDIADGQGVYTWPDGQKYEGTYKEGKRNG